MLPGVKVGPLDPDRTEQFGQVGRSNSARQLIRLHAQAHPPELVRVLSLKQDVERTKGLDPEEVADYLESLSLENGDPAIPDGAVYEGAAVRGERERPQYLTYVYRTESGRTGKWFADYTEDELPNSYADGSERVQIADLREKGIVATGGDTLGGAERETKAERELRVTKQKLANAEEALATEREQAAAAKAAPDEADTDDSADAGDGDTGAEPDTPIAAQEPPDGYEDMNAADVVKLLKDEDTTDEERQGILDYEKTHANRKSVVAAGEQTLGARGSGE